MLQLKMCMLILFLWKKKLLSNKRSRIATAGAVVTIANKLIPCLSSTTSSFLRVVLPLT